MSQSAVVSPLKSYLQSLTGIVLLHLLEYSALPEVCFLAEVLNVCFLNGAPNVWLCVRLHLRIFGRFWLWFVVCFSVDLMSYVTGFQWDKAKYPTALPLCSLTEIINKVLTRSKEVNTQDICHCILRLLLWKVRRERVDPVRLSKVMHSALLFIVVSWVWVHTQISVKVECLVEWSSVVSFSYILATVFFK